MMPLTDDSTESRVRRRRMPSSVTATSIPAGKEKRAMILASIWSAKGEGRVSRDQKAGDNGK